MATGWRPRRWVEAVEVQGGEPNIQTVDVRALDGSDSERNGDKRVAVPVDAGGQDGEAQSPGALWSEGIHQGEQRLNRRPLSAAATGLVGGFDVMIGVAVAAVVAGSLSAVMPASLAAVLGSLTFGVGFVFITLGRSELFTENFLIPVGAVLEKRKPFRRLGTLWVPTLVANVVGMLILALIMSVSKVLDHHAIVAAGHTATVFAERSAGAAFLSAIIGGLVMTVWTWLGIAVRTDVGRILVALAVGFTIAAPNMNHVIVGTGEMMFGVLGGATRATWGDVGVNFLLALAGNLVGGTMFVTLARFLQARTES